VRETASFIALVRKHCPHVLIGDIEAYPSIPIADHFRWIEALQQRLAGLKVRGLDFYRLDVDWVTCTLRNEGSWRDVKKLELYCRSRKLPFGLIYWASGYPALKQRGLADDATWYVAVMQQGYDYALVDGAPDQYVIESWIEAPSRAVPESDDFTFSVCVMPFMGSQAVAWRSAVFRRTSTGTPSQWSLARPSSHSAKAGPSGELSAKASRPGGARSMAYSILPGSIPSSIVAKSLVT